jgi:hypothetical protein
MLCRVDWYQPGGEAFVRAVNENPCICVEDPIDTPCNQPCRQSRCWRSSYRHQQHPLESFHEKLQIVAYDNRRPFWPQFRGVKPALTLVSINATALRLENIVEYMFLSHTKCLTIIRTMKGTAVILLPRKFGSRASLFESLHSDPAFRFPFQHQILEVPLRWPRFPKLKFTHILLLTSYKRSVCEGLPRGSPVGQHG